MDAATQSYYAANAGAYSATVDTADVESLHSILKSLASTNSRVLEIGGGSGRDAVFMSKLGCDVTYTDGCREIVDEAIRLHPELAENARVAAFPLSDDDEFLRESFDLVVCIAVIMHLDDADLGQLASQLASLTRARGRLVVSHSSGRRGLTAGRDAIGRLFHERPTEDVARALEIVGFEVERQIDDSDSMGRHSLCWTTHVFKKTD
jgi:2-polyprenyl-3-methyl-5-hydroxy-6-metoxy-1,4-benzoquinol methylase